MEKELQLYMVATALPAEIDQMHLTSINSMAPPVKEHLTFTSSTAGKEVRL
jgi:hypothetical protein